MSKEHTTAIVRRVYDEVLNQNNLALIDELFAFASSARFRGWRHR